MQCSARVHDAVRGGQMVEVGGTTVKRDVAAWQTEVHRSRFQGILWPSSKPRGWLGVEVLTSELGAKRAPKRCVNPVKGGNYDIRLGAEIGFSQRGIASRNCVCVRRGRQRTMPHPIEPS